MTDYKKSTAPKATVWKQQGNARVLIVELPWVGISDHRDRPFRHRDRTFRSIVTACFGPS
jgi:hypothetical protein